MTQNSQFLLYALHLREIIPPIFIRKVTQKNRDTNKTYDTYRLVDGYRNAEGKVRQELILNLGANFSIPKKEWKLLADRIEELLSGQKSLLTLDWTLDKRVSLPAKTISKFC